MCEEVNLRSKSDVHCLQFIKSKSLSISLSLCRVCVSGSREENPRRGEKAAAQEVKRFEVFSGPRRWKVKGQRRPLDQVGVSVSPQGRTAAWVS